MKTHNKPPGKKKAGTPADPATLASGRKRQPAAAERTDDREAASPPNEAGGPSREEVISNVVKPITNQDEQDKITNAGTDDIPVPDK